MIKYRFLYGSYIFVTHSTAYSLTVEYRENLMKLQKFIVIPLLSKRSKSEFFSVLLTDYDQHRISFDNRVS